MVNTDVTGQRPRYEGEQATWYDKNAWNIFLLKLQSIPFLCIFPLLNSYKWMYDTWSMERWWWCFAMGSYWCDAASHLGKFGHFPIQTPRCPSAQPPQGASLLDGSSKFMGLFGYGHMAIFLHQLLHNIVELCNWCSLSHWKGKWAVEIYDIMKIFRS